MLMVLIAYGFIWPKVNEDAATSKLSSAYSSQILPLAPTVDGLLGNTGKTTSQCDETSHSRTRVYLYCQEFMVYAPALTPLPDASRPAVLTIASQLDQKLRQNGWTPDRPHDVVTTVRGSVPSTPLPSFYSSDEVPFHKNVGTVSCNFEVDFEGPSDGISPGIILASRMSCQQNVSFFMPSTTNWVNSGFGG